MIKIIKNTNEDILIYNSKANIEIRWFKSNGMLIYLQKTFNKNIFSINKELNKKDYEIIFYAAQKIQRLMLEYPNSQSKLKEYNIFFNYNPLDKNKWIKCKQDILNICKEILINVDKQFFYKFEEMKDKKILLKYYKITGSIYKQLPLKLQIDKEIVLNFINMEFYREEYLEQIIPKEFYTDENLKYIYYNSKIKIPILNKLAKRPKLLMNMLKENNYNLVIKDRG